MYDIRNINIIKTELNTIRRVEGNLVKYIFGISNRTNILLALNIEGTENIIQNDKTELIIRLIENPVAINCSIG